MDANIFGSGLNIYGGMPHLWKLLQLGRQPIRMHIMVPSFLKKKHSYTLTHLPPYNRN